MVLTQAGNETLHHRVIDPGGDPHFFLLFRRLDGTDPVNDGGRIDAPAVKQLLEPQQEPGRPILIDGGGFSRRQAGCQDGDSVLGVVIVGNGRAQLPGLAEQVVDEETVGSVGPQKQRQHPLPGLDPGAGEIKDHRRIGNNQLGNALLFHCGEDILKFGLIHGKFLLLCWMGI